MGADKASEPLASPKGDGLMSPPSPLGLSAGRPVYKPLTIQYDDDEDNDDDYDNEDDEDGSPEDYDEDGGFGQDFPERTSIDFGEDGRVESSPGKARATGTGTWAPPGSPTGAGTRSRTTRCSRWTIASRRRTRRGLCPWAAEASRTSAGARSSDS